MREELSELDAQMWGAYAAPSLEAATLPGTDDLWRRSTELLAAAQDYFKRGQIGRACRLAYAANQQAGYRGDKNVAAGAPLQVRRKYALPKGDTTTGNSAAQLLGRVLHLIDLRLGGDAKMAILKAVDIELGIDGDPANPNRARDRFMPVPTTPATICRSPARHCNCPFV